MKTKSLILIFCMGWSVLAAQKLVVDKSLVTFYSHATIEDIKAENKKTAGIFNVSTNDIAFSIPISEFQFAKSLMQEHFNEKYMETDKFPKATFQGKINDYDASIVGQQKVKAIGKMTIHGVTRDVEIPGTIEKQGNKFLIASKFIAKLDDYKIEIPKLFWERIAEQVEVTVEFTFKSQ